MQHDIQGNSSSRFSKARIESINCGKIRDITRADLQRKAGVVKRRNVWVFAMAFELELLIRN